MKSKQKQASPLTKQEIDKHPDPKIDQDFPGFPAAPSEERLIHPATPADKKTAALNQKDGEKHTHAGKGKEEIDEQGSDASGGAFEATEEVKE